MKTKCPCQHNHAKVQMDHANVKDRQTRTWTNLLHAHGSFKDSHSQTLCKGKLPCKVKWKDKLRLGQTFSMLRVHSKTLTPKPHAKENYHRKIKWKDKLRLGQTFSMLTTHSKTLTPKPHAKKSYHASIMEKQAKTT